MNRWLLKYSWTCSVFNANQVSDVVCSCIHKSWSHRSRYGIAYTALLYTQKESSKYNRNYFIVTFDQPLFIKAVYTIAASPELCNVFPRLDVFYDNNRFHNGRAWLWASCPIKSDRQSTSLSVADNWIDEDGLWEAVAVCYQCVDGVLPVCWWSCILTCPTISNTTLRRPLSLFFWGQQVHETVLMNRH